MANLELEGTLQQKLPVQSGTSARGDWSRQDFILEYQDGNFPAQICVTAWGQDKVNDLARFQEGDKVKVAFNIRGREYNGRWYNDIRVWRLSAAEDVRSSAHNQSGQEVPAPPPFNSAPAPGLDDMPGDIEDDLPF